MLERYFQETFDRRRDALSAGVNRLAGPLRSMDVRLAALLVQFLVSIAFSLMGSFLPLFMSSDLGNTLIEATYWTGISQLVASSLMALTAPFWGLMCDRVGTKKIMMVVLLGNTIVYAGMAVATNVIHIVIFRGLQGTFGGLSTVMFALVASIVPARELKKALSYQMAVMTLGSIIAPGIGGLLASVIGYRLTFAASSLLFVSIAPMASAMGMPPPVARTDDAVRLKRTDLKAVLPDAISLVLVYSCISFISPTIPWFLETLGIPYEGLLLFTAIATIASGIAFVAATPILTKVITDRTLPILSATTAGTIFLTAFVADPLQFIAVRVAASAIQAGIPPSLLGGRAGRKGAAMGLLNSARFMGMAVGPFVATSILGDGEPPKAFYMFSAMAVISIAAAIVIYLTHTRVTSKQRETSPVEIHRGNS